MTSIRAMLPASVLLCLLSQLGCTSHATQDAGSATESSTSTTSSATPTSDESALLSEAFSWNGGSFRYPTGWPLYQFNAVSSFTFLVAVLSNERVHDLCTRAPTSVSCGEPLSHLNPGGVLVTWTQFGMAGAGIAQQPGAATTVDGRAARELVTDGPAAGCAGVSGTTAEVDAAVRLDPSDHMWQMRACIAGPNVQQDVTTALAMFHSAHFGPSVWK